MGNRKKRRIIAAACFIALLAAFVISPVFPYARSLAVMKAYSAYCARDSLTAEKGFRLDIPSGEGWYPFVMTYAADSAFSDYTGIPGVRLTILYDFPAFSLKNGCSRLYDESSPYYSGFFGAYVVGLADGAPFGFSEDAGKLDVKTAADIAKFDYFTLVLRDFGLEENKKVFEYSVTECLTDTDFLGYGGWTRISADMTVNGANHEKRDSCASYTAYGAPGFPVSSDFTPVQMNSLVCARYFPEWGCSIFFYVMSPSEEVCEACMDDILSRSVLE